MTSIQIQGDIGEGTATAPAVIAALTAAAGGPVDVYLSSTGGSVWDGLAIHNALAAYPGEVTVHVTGVAASMGSAIALAGDRILIAPNAMMMIHNPTLCANGDGDGLRETADMLDKVQAALADTYCRRTGRTLAEILPAMAAETWFGAADAVAFGLADAVETDPQQQPTTLPPAAQTAATARAVPIPLAAASLIRQELARMANATAPRGAAAPKAAVAPPPPAADSTPPPAATPDNIPAVDTTSPNYKAGVKCGQDGIDHLSADFVAGYAAGKGKAGGADGADPLEPDADDPMAKAAKGPAAKIGDLRAAFPDHPGFALDAAEKGWSVVQAKAAFADVLAVDLKAAKAALAAHMPGTAAIPVLPSDRGDGPGAGKVIAQFEDAVAAKVKAGVPRARAVNLVATADPQMHAAYLAAKSEASTQAAQARALSNVTPR